MSNDHQEEYETTYVVVEVEGTQLPPEGSRLHLQGLNTANPVLKLEDGTILVGEFQETIGTQMIFQEDIVPPDAIDKTEERQHGTVELLCHTDKKLHFKKSKQ